MEYEQNRDRLKLCALCWNRIKKDWVVCEDHISDMEKYRNEFWFQELVREQQRQYEIDLEEFTLLKGGNLSSLAEKSVKPRTKLTNTDKSNITRLLRQGLGWRRIAKTLKLNPKTVDKYVYRLKKIDRHFSK